MEQKKRVYLSDWDHFLQTSMEILLDHPLSRASVKYDNRRQVAILKVTDNKKVVMYKVKVAKEVSIKPGGNKVERILDTHFNQIEQFVKLSSKLLLKVDPNEEPREQTKSEDQSKKKKKGKGNKK